MNSFANSSLFGARANAGTGGISWAIRPVVASPKQHGGKRYKHR
ncbi:MAG TPA: hypothetical protein VHB79_34530 [Polyangiaceae bacterium]|nr:hypothetical protein [Polyangiaceae bacterium]